MPFVTLFCGRAEDRRCSFERHSPAARRRCKVKKGGDIFNLEILNFGSRPSFLIPRKRLPDTQNLLGTGREKHLSLYLESNPVFPICCLYSLVAFHVQGDSVARGPKLLSVKIMLLR